MDGYFDGGTAPWRTQGVGGPGSRGAIAAATAQGRSLSSPHKQQQKQTQQPLPALLPPGLPACTWSAVQPGTYLAGCDAENCKAFPTAAAAEAACVADLTCGGITSQAAGAAPFELRAGNVPTTSPTGEASYYITNLAACRPPVRGTW